MLTKNEENLIKQIGRLTTGFKQVIEDARMEGELEGYDGDMVEIVAKIHDLQNWVIANGEARDNHDYRLLGCVPWHY